MRPSALAAPMADAARLLQISRTDLGAGDEGASRPLQALEPGILVGSAEPLADDCDPYGGLFHRDEDPGQKLRCVPHQRAAPVDILFAGAYVFRRIDRG